jgi:mannosyltransferase OCH1-like enzyme
MIPKIIWRVWLSDTKSCPDFKEVEGYDNKLVTLDNLSEYVPDWKTEGSYLKVGYDEKKWVHMADLVRLLLLVKYGGIYLDTDIEVIKPFDDLLEEDMFVGFEDNNYVNTAVIGSAPAESMIVEYINRRDRIAVILFNMTPGEGGPKMFTELLRDYGLVTSNKTQGLRIGDENIKILNSKAFYPYHYTEKYDPKCITPETYTIHKWNKSW